MTPRAPSSIQTRSIQTRPNALKPSIHKSSILPLFPLGVLAVQSSFSPEDAAVATGLVVCEKQSHGTFI